ncbi:MAG TPA: TonB-dependent siderophore receptor [Verrucomicrobiae bacterium]
MKKYEQTQQGVETNPESLRKPSIATLALVNVIMLAGAGAAQAQTNTPPAVAGSSTNAPTKLPDVVITGEKTKDETAYKPEQVANPKYTTPLVDTAQTITVIPKAVIEQQGATTLSEIMRNIPGVTMLAGEGGGASSSAGDTFFMRGFDASNNIFVDGVRNQGLITRDAFNLEAVEVFKGPTGSDTGRGNGSGYVNIVTKSPALEPFYRASLGYNSADNTRFTADVNQPLQLGEKDTWLGGSALRLNGLVQGGGVAGRDYVERNSWGISPSLALGLGTPTRVVFTSTYTEQDNIPDYGLPTATLNGNSGIDRENYYGNVLYDFEEVSQFSAGGRIEHDLSDSFTLRNNTVYTETHRLAVITGLGNINAAGQVARMRQANERYNKIFSNQTSGTIKFDTGPLEHAVVTGLEYTWEEQYTPTVIGAGTAAVTPFDGYNPDPYYDVTGYGPVRNGAYSRGSTDTVALYLFDTIDIGERWQVNGGVRWEHYATHFTSVDATQAVTADLGADGHILSSKAGLLFKPASNGSTYFGFGRTMTPPGSANFNLSGAAGNVNNASTDPQIADNFELGTKWEFFKERLAVNASVFRTINHNILTPDPLNVGSFIYDSREQIVNGVEWGVAGRITDEWQVFANWSYLNTEFSDPANAANGAAIQWTPEFSMSLWTTYRLPFGLTLGGGARYVSTIARQTTNTPGANMPEAPDYWVFDAMLQYDITKNINVRLNIYNLADELYSSSLNNNGGRFNPGTPRSAYLTANFSF